MKAAKGLLVVAVIALAVIAALVLSRAPAAPIASSSTQTSTLPTTLPTTSAISISTSGSTALSQQLASFLAENISAVSQFFGSVQAFTITLGSGTGQEAVSTTQSWTYVGSPTINRTSFSEVIVDCSGSQPCQYPSPYTLWVADNGSVPIIQYGGKQYPYPYALYSGGPTIGLEVMVGFSVAPYLSGSFPSYFVFNGTGSFQAGTTQIPTYTWYLSKPITYPGVSLNQASITLGVIPGGHAILLRLIAAGTSNGAGVVDTDEVTSLTLA